jgi:hypothetical protein
LQKDQAGELIITILTTRFTTLCAREDITGTSAETGDMIASRRRDSSSEIATGCESIQTMNRTRITINTESLTRRAVVIEMNGVTTKETIEDKAGDKSGLPRTDEILLVGLWRA